MRQPFIHQLFEESKIGSNTAVGPFAHIRPESILGDRVKIGNFVEVKKSTLGEGSKVITFKLYRRCKSWF